MIEFLIPLLRSFISSGIFDYVIWPIFCLCFVACVPCIIMYFVRR